MSNTATGPSATSCPTHRVLSSHQSGLKPVKDDNTAWFDACKTRHGLELSRWHTKAVTRKTLRGVLAHSGPRLVSLVPGPSPKDPGLRNVFPRSWDPFASDSIPPTQVAVKAQCNNMMAPIRRPRPLSGATDLSDVTERTSGSDQAIEVDVC